MPAKTIASKSKKTSTTKDTAMSIAPRVIWGAHQTPNDVADIQLDPYSMTTGHTIQEGRQHRPPVLPIDIIEKEGKFYVVCEVPVSIHNSILIL